MSRLIPETRRKYALTATRLFKWILTSNHNAIPQEELEAARGLQAARIPGISNDDIATFLRAVYLKCAKNLSAGVFSTLLFVKAASLKTPGEPCAASQISSLVAQLLYWGRTSVLMEILATQSYFSSLKTRIFNIKQRRHGFQEILRN